MIPYGRQSISEEDIDYVIQTLKSEWITQGPKVEEFEKEIEKKIGCDYSVAANSATSCLHLACKALDLKKMIGFGQVQIVLLLALMPLYIVERRLTSLILIQLLIIYVVII